MKEDERKEICRRVKAIRKETCGDVRGAQRTFADHVDVSYGTYRNYEDSRVCLGALKKIALKSGVTIDAIVFGGHQFEEELKNIKKVPVYKTKKDELFAKEIAKSKWKDIHELSEAVEKVQNGELVYEKDPMVNMVVRINIVGGSVSLMDEDRGCIINPEDLKEKGE